MMRKQAMQQELIAGITSFFAISYIMVVNSLILTEAGMPPLLSIFATIFASMAGTFLVGIVANTPIVITPGMGVNAFFTYTLVSSMGFTWQQALAVSLVAGLLFVGITLTPLGKIINESVPESLKHGITSGIGLLLVMIGMEKGHLLVAGEHSFLSIAPLNQIDTLLTLLGFLFVVILVMKKVRGGMFIALLVITIVGNLLGIQAEGLAGASLSHLGDYGQLLFAMDFQFMGTGQFWLAVFSLLMILMFESLGLLNGLLSFLPKEEVEKAYRLTGISVVISSLLGTSPTIPAAESAAGIENGGRTRVTSTVVFVLFGLSLFLLPFLSYIPDQAIAPLIMMTGFLMLQDLRLLNFADFYEWFPALFLCLMIPLSGSIGDGLAYGFIAYTLLQLVGGRARQTKPALLVIAALFLVNLIVTNFM